MNIKSRIKKIENQIIGGRFEFCGCFPQFNTEIYLQDLSAGAKSSEAVLSGEVVSEVCLRCRKTIEKQKIIIRFCDHSTKTRFPVEWNNQT